jgi:hypothetical protein
MHSRGNGWLTFNASAAEAEKLLQTEYYTYDHSIESRSAVGCDEYVLSAHHVSFDIKPSLTALPTSTGINSHIMLETMWILCIQESL